MGRDNSIPLVSLSFAAGAASATILCWFIFRKHGSNDEFQQQLLQKLDALRSRAGNARWPWDFIGRSPPPPEEPEMNIKTPVRPQEKTGLCIGSIFGMDVGGSLTKLVYFEEREVESHLKVPNSEDPSKSKPLHIRRSTSADVWVFPSSDSSERYERDRRESLPNLDDFGADVVKSSDADESLLGKTSDDVQKGLNIAGPVSKPFEKRKSSDHERALDDFYTFARGFSQFQSGVRDTHLSFYSRELGGDFHFIQFETRQMESAMDLIRSHKLHSNIRKMGATGGGAHKFAPAWERVLGIQIHKEDELDSLVAGMQFVLSSVIGECYSFRPKSRKRADRHDSHNDSRVDDGDESESEHDMQKEADGSQGDEWWWSRKVRRDAISPSATYPYLLVTIGTGVSVLRVDGPRKHVRVSGSTIGGGTYWGLIRLLTSIDNFENVLKLAERGDASKVDMMVGDIYGKDSKALDKIGLPANLVASSFGKLIAKQNPANGLKQEDVARALLLMVTNNIGQVAYLNAQLAKTPRIYFVGNFLRNNKISQRRLAYAINYWSKGEMEALFLEREGYLGALGAFLLSQGISQTDTGFFQKVDQCLEPISM